MPLTIPKCVSKMTRQKIPATTDAIAHGSSTAMKKRPEPRKPRLSTSAVTSASGSVTAVVSAARISVRGIASVISLSDGQSHRVVVQPDEPDDLVLGQLDPEEAEAEDGQDRRQDDHREQDESGNRDQERELALAQAVQAARNATSAPTDRRPGHGHEPGVPPRWVVRESAGGPAEPASNQARAPDAAESATANRAPRAASACGATSVAAIAAPDEGLVDLDAEARPRRNRRTSRRASASGSVEEVGPGGVRARSRAPGAAASAGSRVGSGSAREDLQRRGESERTVAAVRVRRRWRRGAPVRRSRSSRRCRRRSTRRAGSRSNAPRSRRPAASPRSWTDSPPASGSGSASRSRS